MINEKDIELSDNKTINALYAQLSMFLSSFTAIKSATIKECVSLLQKNMRIIAKEGEDEQMRVIDNFLDAVVKMAEDLDEILPDEEELPETSSTKRYLN